ncbi:MAG: thiol:disulfide interchange protein DsbA/DsbL [Gammaproteobacteria bacterium]
MTRSLFVLLGFLLVSTAAAADEEFRAGRHFDIIEPPAGTSVAEDKVEVVEMFWYGCPHCYQFEPEIAAWLETKADYIEFVRIPAVFAPNWEVHARAFYAAEQLGVLDKVHEPLFEALHRDRRKIFTVDELAAFYAEHGVSEKDFRAAYDSFDVDKKARRAAALTREYGIGGVPAVIVDGKYRSGTPQSGSYENLLKIVDFLAAKEANR